MKVAIVGGGVIGLCTAYEMARAGIEVVIVERGRAGAGASSNNAGWVVPIMAAPVSSPGMLLKALMWLPRRSSPLGMAMSLEREHMSFLWSLARNCNQRRFEEACQSLVGFAASAPREFAAYGQFGAGVEQYGDGILLMFHHERNLTHWQEQLAGVVGSGAGYEVVGAERAAELQPALAGSIGAFAYCPGEARVDPGSLVTALAQECRSLGVELQEGACVTGFERSGKRVRAVFVGDTRISADVVVLSSGAWTAGLCRLLGVGIPIRPGKGYGFDVGRVKGMSNVAVYLSEARVNLSPLERGLRVSGVMEFGGLDLKVDRVRAGAVLSAPAGYLRGWAPAAAAVPWVGVRPMTPDGLPCIGWLDGYENVLVAAGHALFGVTLAPATAKALVHCVVTGVAPAEVRPFRPGRFARSARAA